MSTDTRYYVVPSCHITTIINMAFQYTVKDRFLRYVKIDTQADPMSETYPSSMKQKDLTRLIVQELMEMGLSPTVNEAGYIYVRIPSNVAQPTKTVFFCAHLDTAPDCSGTDVKPIVHHNYQGEELVLPDDPTQRLSPHNHPDLAKKIGHDIITASGLTLLGADDKAGVAAIVDAFYQLTQNPDLPHGEVVALLTTDEEIGKGTVHVNPEVLNADFGYTLDSGEVGHFEYENFSADAATLIIEGVSAHPGTAKGKMRNAIKIASEIIAQLPKDHLTPETTEGKQGFIHPTKIKGELERAQVDFILRSFDTDDLKNYANIISSIAKEVLKDYPDAKYHLETKVQYRNMRDVIEQHMYAVDYALEAMSRHDITPVVTGIRGGTDGAVLSHKGFPCPNIFAGQHAIHSKQEWTTVQDLQKAVDIVIELCQIVAENGQN